MPENVDFIRFSEKMGWKFDNLVLHDRNSSFVLFFNVF